MLTKASDLFNLEQLCSEMFTQRVSQSGGTGKEVAYNLFTSFSPYLQQSSTQNNLELCIEADHQNYLRDSVTQLHNWVSLTVF